MGRSILTEAGSPPATRSQASRHGRPLRATAPHQLPTVPDAPTGLINKLDRPGVQRGRGTARHRRSVATTCCRSSSSSTRSTWSSDWNRVYGPRGFLQWQYVVPDEAAEVVPSSLERLCRGRACRRSWRCSSGSGRATTAPLSFPTKGWTLAFDTDDRPGLDRLFDELDEMVVAAGGRIYLAKDSRVRPELVPVDVPATRRVARGARQADPDGRFRSDLSRRLAT